MAQALDGVRAADLLRGSREPTDEEVRQLADDLARMGAGATPELIRALHEPSQLARDAAALALGQLHAETVVAPADGCVGEMVDGAVAALARTRPKEVANLLQPTAATPEVWAKLLEALASGLEDSHDPQPGQPVRRALLRTSRGDPDPTVRKSAQKALAALSQGAR